MVIMPSSVSIFSYTATASAVNIFFPWGNWLFLGVSILFCDYLGLVLVGGDLPIVFYGPPIRKLLPVGCLLYQWWIFISVLVFHLREEVDIGVPVCPHLSVEVVFFYLIELLSMFWNCGADFVSEFFCVEYPFIWGEPLVCVFVWEVCVYLHMDVLVTLNYDWP